MFAYCTRTIYNINAKNWKLLQQWHFSIWSHKPTPVHLFVAQSTSKFHRQSHTNLSWYGNCRNATSTSSTCIWKWLQRISRRSFLKIGNLFYLWCLLLLVRMWYVSCLTFIIWQFITCACIWTWVIFGCAGHYVQWKTNYWWWPDHSLMTRKIFWYTSTYHDNNVF